ncbi:MAG TPA: transketolase, partial [Candidatus Wirthbacteria bacterium]|nr:transketolase [Candidatus Wirthbacteria bacterium]
MTEFSNQQVELFADNLAVLAAETVEKANSGHPGAPLGMCRIMAELFLNHLKFDPANPSLPNRDRFILSAGHASAGLYALLHLSGYDLSLDDLKQFRQWQSLTPGHPERDLELGIEMTTGPLGQGIATSVGVALGLKNLGARYDQLIDPTVYVLASEGDLQEGISYEACSLAGHWGLGNLIVMLDRNQISIDGSTDLSFTEDIRGRFEAQHWVVQEVDGTEVTEIRQALEKAKTEAGKPSLIICRI